VHHNGVERYATTSSLTRQHRLFATCWDTDTPDAISATSTATGVDRSSWLDNVQCRETEKSIADGLHTGWGRNDCGHHQDVSVLCVPVPDSTEAVALVGGGIHGLDVSKCSAALGGEPSVMTDSLTQQQGLFATLWDSDTSDERWTSTSTVWATG